MQNKKEQIKGETKEGVEAGETDDGGREEAADSYGPEVRTRQKRKNNTKRKTENETLSA